MEFYEFLEKICSFIPGEYESVKSAAESIMPVLFALFAGATSFFGHFMHKVWNVFFFFGIGFFIPLLALFAWFNPSGAVFWILVVLCAICGVACACYSKHLSRFKLFIISFFMTYIAVPQYLSFLGKFGSALAGFAVAAVAAVMSIKYKYIAVICTTAFSGALMLWNTIEGALGLNHFLVMLLAALTGAAGLAVQCLVERKELKETYKQIKKKSKKVRDYVGNKYDADFTKGKTE